MYAGTAGVGTAAAVSVGSLTVWVADSLSSHGGNVADGPLARSVGAVAVVGAAVGGGPGSVSVHHQATWPTACSSVATTTAAINTVHERSDRERAGTDTA